MKTKNATQTQKHTPGMLPLVVQHTEDHYTIITAQGNFYAKTYDEAAARLIAAVLGLPMVRKNGHDGLKVGGCGMDMGFSVVYNLGATLWPGGDGKTITGRNGDKGPETDGGYLLNHRWL